MTSQYLLQRGVWVGLIWLLFQFPLHLEGQDYALNVQRIGVEDGLSSPNVISFLQDTKGFIWLGTSYGLNRYDGTNIRSYTREQDGLCHNYVHGIAEDTKGSIWVLGGDFGRNERCFCILDATGEQLFSIEEYLGTACPFDPNMTNMSPNYQGTIIFREEKSAAYQFYEFDGKRMKKGFALPKSDQQARLGEVDYVFKLDVNTYVSQMNYYRTPERRKIYDKVIYFGADGLVQRTIPEGKGQGFVESDGQHVYIKYGEYDVETVWTYIKDEEICGRVLSARGYDELFFAGKNLLKINGKGLEIFDPGSDSLSKSVQFIPLDAQSIPGRSDIFIDRSGSLWYQNENHIILLNIRPVHFELAFQNQEVNQWATPLRGLVTSPDGRLYAGSLNYLFIQKNKEPSQKIKNESQGEYIGGRLGFLYNGGYLWQGTEQFGLWKYDPLTGQDWSYKVDDLQSKELLFWMPHMTAQGDVWVGAGQGLYHLNQTTQKLEAFAPSEEYSELTNSSVYHFHSHEKGTWLATSSGLYLVNLEQEHVLAHYSSSQPKPFFLPAHHIAHIYEDKDGSLWLASKGQGLVQFDPAHHTAKHFNKANTGLSHDVLYAVYEDDFDNLWIPSDLGLNRYHKPTSQVTTYLKEDGLPHNEFNTISHHQDANGKLYFGTLNGMISFHPKDIFDSEEATPLYITQCARIDQETDSVISTMAELLATHQINILPGDKSLDLQLALVNFEKRKGKLYGYRVVGYHKDWIYQEDPHIKLIGLPYGNFELLLKGKVSGSNQWVNYKQPIQLSVRKPIYLQTWFVMLVLLGMIGLILISFRLNNRRLRLRQQELEKMVEERTEKIQRQAEELKSLDKVKSRFFANISHELRTPLTLILGPLSFLLDDPAYIENEEIQKQLQVMQRNGRSLMELIEEILDLSKLEANKLELQEEPTSVAEYFEHLFFVFEPQFQAQQIAYDLIFQISEGLHIQIDRKKMAKILNNFLSNAIKYTPKGGKVTLEISENEETIRVRVLDTGAGIHPDDLPYIFERFFQSKRAEQKLYGGTGIGLALVNEFAQLMGGKVFAESSLGIGSTFHFEWPKRIAQPVQLLNQIEEVPLDEAAAIEEIGTEFTILVVEDNPDMLAFITQILEKKYHVMIARDGAEGLALLEKHGLEISLVVSDVMMPEVDGLTMLKYIKSHDTLFRIPVVMLTALAAERDKLNALTIGVDDYLTKPFSVPELVVRVQNLLYNYQQRNNWREEESLDSTEESSSPTQAEAIETTEQDQAWIREIEAFIFQSLPENKPNVEMLAATFFLSPRQLRRKLKSITGLSPARFIKEVQLQAARKELEAGKIISIAEVAYRYGFEHGSTFSNVFKNRFGKSPSEYVHATG